MIRTSNFFGADISLPWLLIVIFCSHLLLLNSCKERPDQTVQVTTEPPSVDLSEKAGFVKREICIECHEEQYMEWTGSNHDLSMDIASERTVRGDFDNATLAYQDLTFTFYRREDKYFIRMNGPGNVPFDYEVAYVLGVSPLQQYMIEFPGGQIQIPFVAWDSRTEDMGGQRWFHIQPDQSSAFTGGYDREDRFLNWNSLCGECHTTNFRKNYDLKTDSFRSTWTMIDIGCQACHGPGSNHVRWARFAEGEESKKTEYDAMGLEVALNADDSAVEIEACARCHSNRVGLGSAYEYGKPFMDQYAPRVLTPPWYYPDGQIRDDVYVYGSFVQSKKYSRGIRCTDCHDPHTARLRTYGNELCIHCHSSPPAAQFSYLRDVDYDSPLHHFHKENSPGAQCIACHMSGDTHVLAGLQRDHGFRIPRPDFSDALAVPNACNRCHTDKSAQWAADKINQVHPHARKRREKEVHFAKIFSDGRSGVPAAESGLVAIAGNRSESSIVRATALNILSGFRGDKAVGMTALSLLDESPLVRYEAVKALSEMIPGESDGEGQKKKYSLIAPRLKDSVRAVRSEAARAIAEIPQEFHRAAEKPYFDNGIKEYMARQEAISERPEAHNNLGILYENLGEDTIAEASYMTAIRLDADFFTARFKLADLYKRTGRYREAEQKYLEIIEREPENGEAHYLLGLLQSDDKRLDDAVSSLGIAVELMPGQARVRYDYALALKHLGRNNEALMEMLYAHEIDRQDAAVVQALVKFNMQDGQWESALYYAQLLVTLVPDAERPKHMLKQIEQTLKTDKHANE